MVYQALSPHVLCSMELLSLVTNRCNLFWIDITTFSSPREMTAHALSKSTAKPSYYLTQTNPPRRRGGQDLNQDLNFLQFQMTKRNKNYQQYIPSIPKKKLKTKDNLTVYQKAHFKTHIIFTVQFRSSQIKSNQIKNHNEQNTNISTKLVDYFPPL